MKYKHIENSVFNRCVIAQMQKIELLNFSCVYFVSSLSVLFLSFECPIAVDEQRQNRVFDRYFKFI